MMSMALLDKVLWVDPDSMRVRVEAGCRVQQVADELKQYGLSLQNYASIREQQIGGFTQVRRVPVPAGLCACIQRFVRAHEHLHKRITDRYPPNLDILACIHQIQISLQRQLQVL
eukprot:GHRQ01025157.1.p3 GENE.GHRQ01025157.1~~GHRQ01025157.1.p3  ORF type:complete len:115 (+),score=27.13 GHRQ01025157.1:1170-1514(+)